LEEIDTTRKLSIQKQKWVSFPAMTDEFACRSFWNKWELMSVSVSPFNSACFWHAEHAGTQEQVLVRVKTADVPHCRVASKIK